jgi:hypothetical protein
MAAVLALIMLPIIASIGLFVSVISGDGRFSTVLAGATFGALGLFVLFGALRIMRDSEARDCEGSEHAHPH